MAEQGEFDAQSDATPKRHAAPTKVALDQTELSDLLKPVESDWTGVDAVEGPAFSVGTTAHVGRYVIVNRIGRGGFGKVFLARDTELDRMVAIKLPHLERMKDEHLKEIYLQEAKTLAKLDHPSIVPIYDCGVVADGRCFVVSKYIQGRDLAKHLAAGPMQFMESVRLLIVLAEALHFVHRSGFVHRDIKPANLLLGDDGRVYVADFGLAVRDETTAELTSVAGTPSYMSPEQIRREGHRMDGRSDQFSLGVVMYEMLTDERPFSGSNSAETMQQILTREPRPPRQLNPSIPAQLNRICLKLLSKLASQRYSETIELAHDLRDWLKGAESSSIELTVPTQAIIDDDRSNSAKQSSRLLQPTVMVPRGLRSFNRADAYFFLDLLPDPRDRDGLPELVSHWKRWTEVDQDEPAFHRVGVISGPTGCGKSSLVRAGLLPVLDAHINTLMVEASADLTEKQLVSALRRRVPDAMGQSDKSLADCLESIRRSGPSNGESLLIVIDQFEQWLNANSDLANSELVSALRQCDGFRVQTLLIVRDDFWLALSRFMAAVEVPLQVGRNAMMVDLFDLRHARKVLIEFGRGYQRLPIDSNLTRDQEKFIEGAIAQLKTDGSVIPVHLALFGEMVKNREWSVASLRQLGGAAGVGVQFLDESFSATYAPVHQRTHELAARNVLSALLPPLGSEIKSSRRTRAELLSRSGYENDLAKFDALMAILNSDLKLISAIDSFENSRAESSLGLQEEAAFQLSHDFLVPSIREWLSAKQRASFQGRLKQRLAEQASLWSQQRLPRFLPNFFEGALARILLPQKSLSEVEHAMLRARERRSAAVALCAVAIIAFVTWVFQSRQSAARIATLVEQLETADGDMLPRLVGELKLYGAKANQALNSRLASPSENSYQRFVLQVASQHFDDSKLDEVFEGSLNHMTAKHWPVVTDALMPKADRVAARYWREIENFGAADGVSPASTTTAERAFRAAQILARLQPPGENDAGNWSRHAGLIADLLVSACSRHPDDYSPIAESMRPAFPVLLESLERIFSSETDDGKTRYATALLASYTAPESTLRTRLALSAVGWQRDVLFPRSSLWNRAELWLAARAPVDETMSIEAQNRTARQTATAAALLMTQSPSESTIELLSLLRRSPNPTLRTHLISQLKEVGVPAVNLVAYLREAQDPGIQCGLMMAIREYPSAQLQNVEDEVGLVKQIFRSTGDAGVQATASWLLQQWGEELGAMAVLDALPGTNRRADDAKLSEPAEFSFVRIDARTVPGIERVYSIADREVSIKQFREFRSNEYFSQEFGPSDRCPANVVEWREAIAYCNWLSKRDGISPIYPETDEEAEQWIGNAEDLSKPGYRLPTVAEWEFACRGGTSTSWHFGTDVNLLKHYAVYESDNRDRLAALGNEDKAPKSVSRACGSLRPNDFGLFDMHGNVEEWCNDAGLFNASERRVRGGAASFYAFALKVDSEASLPPRIQHNSLGFRVVRINN